MDSRQHRKRSEALFPLKDDDASLRAKIDSHESTFRGWGWHVEVDSSRPVVRGMGREVFGIPILGDRLGGGEDSETVSGWIYRSYNTANRVVDFICSLNGKTLEQRPLPPEKDFEISQKLDRTYKSVTARSMGTYAFEFALPYEEIWPQNADVTVVGDPYQLCDRHRATIVDYEYIDEILPPFERWKGSTNLHQEVSSWFRTLHAGNERSLEMLYSGWGHGFGNPYEAFIDKCVDAMTTIMETGGTVSEAIDMKLKELKREYRALHRGSWSTQDYAKVCEGEAEAQERMRLLFEWKERSIRFDEKSWSDYFQAWDHFFESIPAAVSANNQFDDYRRQVDWWKKELSTMVGRPIPERLQRCYNQLQGIYEHMLTTLRALPEYDSNTIPYSSELTDARSTGMMSDSPFGIAQPGLPLNFRANNYLAEGVGTVERIKTYFEKINPTTEAERQRIATLGIPFDPDTLQIYLGTLEQAAIRSYLFTKRTEKAVVLHGYFPQQVELDAASQDRIIALYSVSTHVWANYDQAEFLRDIKQTVCLLKPGGKYIVGPINYQAYRAQRFETHGDGYIFPGTDLQKALEELRVAGKVDYYFKKSLSDNDGEELVDTMEFSDADCAAALVVTRKS
ncbi:MAG: hypothetical protein HY565_04105 [Candidatus Kerfeldbacteria bacterium]|nr:hypothetical protein [Candidatus Kerfeldbacteria bacterium]